MMQRQQLLLDNFPRPSVARTLSPNGRAHHMQRARATEAVAIHVRVMAIMQGLRRMQGPVVMQPTFVYPVRRKRDDDNAATGVLKATRDALVRGSWLEADDVEHLRQLPVEMRIEKGRRALELSFEWTEAAQSAPVHAADGTQCWCCPDVVYQDGSHEAGPCLPGEAIEADVP
jgi:hypothetical protein